MPERVWCALFAVAIFVGLVVVQSFLALERPEVFWPVGEETAWCYWDDPRHKDLICFAGPQIPDTGEIVPWVE
jgi:hypothetical protein